MVLTYSSPQLKAKDQAALVFDILLSCSTPQLSASHCERIRQHVLAGLDWQILLRAAVQHRIVPLLHQGLTQACPDLIPAQIEQFLSRNCQINRLKNIFLDRKLTEILSWFEQAGIPVISYKGPALARFAYPNIFLRQFADLDLLVRPQDYEKSQSLLQQQGLVRQMDLGWEMHYVSPDQQLNVDLHQSLVPDFFGLPKNFIDPQSLALSAEDWLIILAIQFGKDCCHWKVGLRQLVDVAQLLNTHPAMDYAEVFQRAKALGCSRFLGIVLILVQDLFQQELPSDCQALLTRDRSQQQLAQWVRDRMEAEIIEPTVVPEDPGFWYFLTVYNHRFYLQVRERWQDKLLYCVYWIVQILRVSLRPNQADLALVKLPHFLHFLYVPIHVLRLLHKHLMRRVISIFRDKS